MNCFSIAEDIWQFLTLSTKQSFHPHRRKERQQDFSEKGLTSYQDLLIDYQNPEDNYNDLIISTIYQKTETEVCQYSTAYENPAEESDRKTYSIEQPFVEVTVVPGCGEKQCIKLFSSKQKHANVYRSKSLNEDKETNVFFFCAGSNNYPKRRTKKKSKFVYSANKRISRNEKTTDLSPLLDYLNMEKKRKKEKFFVEDKSVYRRGSSDIYRKNDYPSPCSSTDDNLNGIQSRIKITGRLGLSNDDQYIVQCKATIDDKEIPVECGESDFYSNSWNYRSNKSNQTKCTSSNIKEERALAPQIQYQCQYPEFNMQQRTNYCQPSPAEAFDKPLIVISVYSPQSSKVESCNQTDANSRIPIKTSRDNGTNTFSDTKKPLTANSNRKKDKSISQSMRPARVMDSGSEPRISKRKKSFAPRKGLTSLSLPKTRVASSQSLEHNGLDVAPSSISSLTNRASSSFNMAFDKSAIGCCQCEPKSSKSNVNQKRSSSPSKPSKIVRKTPSNSKTLPKKTSNKSSKVVERVSAVTSPLKKGSKNKSPPRSSSPGKKEKVTNKVKGQSKKSSFNDTTKLASEPRNKNSQSRSSSPRKNAGTQIIKPQKPNSVSKNKTKSKKNSKPETDQPVQDSLGLKNVLSKIKVNIEGIDENYDLSFYQGPDVANVYILKQIKNGLANIKNKCHYCRNKACNFQNQYPPMMDQTCVTSEHLRTAIPPPKPKICEFKQCPARKFLDIGTPQIQRKKQTRGKQESLDLSHRHSEGNSTDVKNDYSRRSDGRIACVEMKENNNYSGDGCKIVNPVERCKQLRELLCVRQNSSSESQNTPTLCSMDCLYKQCHSPKSSHSFTNTVPIPNDTNVPISIHVLTEKGTGSNSIHESESIKKGLSKSLESVGTKYRPYLSENNENIANTSLYKQLVLDHDMANEFSKIHSNRKIGTKISSLLIGEVRKITKNKSQRNSSKEIQVDSLDRISETLIEKEDKNIFSYSPTTILTVNGMIITKSVKEDISDSESQWTQSQGANTTSVSQVPEYDSSSILTIYKAKEPSITPNLGPSEISFLKYDPNNSVKPNHTVSTKIEKRTKSKKIFRRLIQRIWSSDLRVGEKANMSNYNSSINSYHISTSPIIEMSSSMFDTSASYYSNHSIHMNPKRGFFTSVKGFISNRKNS